VGNPVGKRPLGRPRRRWDDNINMHLVKIEWGDVDWIGLAQDRGKWRSAIYAVMNLLVPKMLGNYCVASQLVASRVVLISIVFS
jgi:hypothetical protein